MFLCSARFYRPLIELQTVSSIRVRVPKAGAFEVTPRMLGRTYLHLVPKLRYSVVPLKAKPANLDKSSSSYKANEHKGRNHFELTPNDRE